LQISKLHIKELVQWWLTLVIVATQEAEIRRSQPCWQVALETLTQKNPSKKKKKKGLVVGWCKV
jgi:hypothetical protein